MLLVEVLYAVTKIPPPFSTNFEYEIGYSEGSGDSGGIFRTVGGTDR
jgi:hypothetical protein